MILHFPAPPVGWRETIASPASSTATHSDGDAHEIPFTFAGVVVGPTAWSTIADRQLEAPSLGLLDQSIEPYSPTATHNETLGHEMASAEYLVANGARWSTSRGIRHDQRFTCAPYPAGASPSITKATAPTTSK